MDKKNNITICNDNNTSDMPEQPVISHYFTDIVTIQKPSKNSNTLITKNLHRHRRYT